MLSKEKPLPDFGNPPVVEVVLSVQFEPIKELKTPHIGLLWDRFRREFPRVQEVPPLEPVIERFGVREPKPSIQLQMLTEPQLPRLLFSNDRGTQLIQVQRDRFVHNWRKMGDADTYPRYESLIGAFRVELKSFGEFLRSEQLGDFRPMQCEVTYVNHIHAGNGWHRFAELPHVMAVLAPQFSSDFLPEPEGIQISLRYIIAGSKGEPIGRLHVNAQPSYRTSDDGPMIQMTLTARGAPQGEGLEGALRFLDIGREWIVRGFASVTTPEMHQQWERRDVR